MGAEVGGFNFVIGADIEEFRKGIQQVQKAMNGLAGLAAKLTEDFAKAAGGDAPAKGSGGGKKKKGKSTGGLIGAWFGDIGAKALAEETIPGLGKALTGLRSPIVGLGMVAVAMTREWMAFHNETDKFRRSVGMTREEMFETQQDLLDVSMRYGTSVSKLASIFTFVATGAARSSKEMAKMAGHFAELEKATGSSQKTIVDFGLALRQSLEMSEDQARATELAIIRYSGMSMMTDEAARQSATEFIGQTKQFGADKRRKLFEQYIALTHAGKQLGGKEESEALGAAAIAMLTKSGGLTGLEVLEKHAFDLQKALEPVFLRLDEADKAGKELVFGEIARGAGMEGFARQALEGWRKINAGINEGTSALQKYKKALVDTQGMTPEQVQQALEGMKGPWQKVDDSIGRIKGLLFDIVTGPLLPAIEGTFKLVETALSGILKLAAWFKGSDKADAETTRKATQAKQWKSGIAGEVQVIDALMEQMQGRWGGPSDKMVTDAFADVRRDTVLTAGDPFMTGTNEMTSQFAGGFEETPLEAFPSYNPAAYKRGTESTMLHAYESKARAKEVTSAMDRLTAALNEANAVDRARVRHDETTAVLGGP